MMLIFLFSCCCRRLQALIQFSPGAFHASIFKLLAKAKLRTAMQQLLR
jgi:hypothetical protein